MLGMSVLSYVMDWFLFIVCVLPFSRSTLCHSIHLMNGYWLQHLETRLSNYLTCENYQEACILSTVMSTFFFLCPMCSVFISSTVIECAVAK
jgi:hypothetical protein